MDKPFSPSTDTPFVPENYYMQIILTKLIFKHTQPPTAAQYSFSVYKATRQFETSKEQTIPAGSKQPITLDRCKLNFMVNSYNPERANNFRVSMNKIIDSKHVKEVGQYIINSNSYIDQYRISENGAFELNIDLCEDFAAEAQLYVDRNQHGLFRVIRDIKNPKPHDDKENKPNTIIMRQRIIDARKQMDVQAEKEGRPSSKDKKFSRFSPRKQTSEEKKHDLFAEKRKQEEEKKAQQEQLLKKREVEEKIKENKKKEPVFKKEWIIPAAEQIKQQIARQTKLKRKASKQSQKSEEKLKTEDNSKMKSVSKVNSSVQQASFMERLPVSPRLLVPILVIILLAAGYFVFSGPADASEHQIRNSRPRKAGKTEKAPKEGKAKGKAKK